MEDAVVADGTAGVEEEPPLCRPNLVHSVLTVASMDTMLHSVPELQVHPEVVELRNRQISATISARHAEVKGEEEIVEAVAIEGPDSRALMLSTMRKETNIRSMKTETSFWNSLKKRMLPSRSKIIKNRETS